LTIPRKQYSALSTNDYSGEDSHVFDCTNCFQKHSALFQDIAYDFRIVAESFETSVPWDRTISLCRNVSHCINTECAKLKISYFLFSYRVTQTYDAGCAVYFYFGYNAQNFEDPIATFEYIEEKARDEIIASGGMLISKSYPNRGLVSRNATSGATFATMRLSSFPGCSNNVSKYGINLFELFFSEFLQHNRY